MIWVPPRFILKGDKEKAAGMKRLGLKELQALEHYMSFNKLGVGRRTVPLVDGSVIDIRKFGDMANITVMAPTMGMPTQPELQADSVSSSLASAGVCFLYTPNITPAGEMYLTYGTLTIDGDTETISFVPEVENLPIMIPGATEAFPEGKPIDKVGTYPIIIDGYLYNPIKPAYDGYPAIYKINAISGAVVWGKAPFGISGNLSYDRPHVGFVPSDVAYEEVLNHWHLSAKADGIWVPGAKLTTYTYYDDSWDIRYNETRNMPAKMSLSGSISRSLFFDWYGTQYNQEIETLHMDESRQRFWAQSNADFLGEFGFDGTQYGEWDTTNSMFGEMWPGYPNSHMGKIVGDDNYVYFRRNITYAGSLPAPPPPENGHPLVKWDKTNQQVVWLGDTSAIPTPWQHTFRWGQVYYYANMAGSYISQLIESENGEEGYVIFTSVESPKSKVYAMRTSDGSMLSGSLEHDYGPFLGEYSKTVTNTF